MLYSVECNAAGMAATSYKHYVACFRNTLTAMLSLYDTPCQARGPPSPTSTLTPNAAIYFCCLCSKQKQQRGVQHVERYSKPEVEVQDSPELLLEPVLICRNAQECALLEASINAVRVSLKVRLAALPASVCECLCAEVNTDVRCVRGMCWSSGWSPSR